MPANDFHTASNCTRAELQEIATNGKTAAAQAWAMGCLDELDGKKQQQPAAASARTIGATKHVTTFTAAEVSARRQTLKDERLEKFNQMARDMHGAENCQMQADAPQPLCPETAAAMDRIRAGLETEGK